MKAHTILEAWLPATIITISLVLGGCDTNDESDDFDIVGTWALTRLEGAPGPVDASNSTWTFRPDGTYSWFLLYEPFFDVQGSGGYSLNGSTLTVDGIVARAVLAEDPEAMIPLSTGSRSFSFRDDEGDRWTYEKVP